MKVITKGNKTLYDVAGVGGALEFQVGDMIEVSTLTGPFREPSVSGLLQITQRIMHVQVVPAKDGPAMELTDITFVVEQIA